MDQYLRLPQYRPHGDQLLFLDQVALPFRISEKVSSMLAHSSVSFDVFYEAGEQALFQRLVNMGVLVRCHTVSTRSTEGVALFIQPHSDDCALSCGGAMAHARFVLGQQVALLTVFSDYAYTYSPWHTDIKMDDDAYSAWRCREDQAVADFLGAELITFSFPEAPRRGIAYPLLRKRLFKKDLKLVDQIYCQVEAILKKQVLDAVYLPASMGWHCDHLIITAMLDLLRSGYPMLSGKIFLYEDYPYSNQSRYHFWGRLSELQAQYKLSPCYIDMSDWLDVKATLMNFYKSQFRPWHYKEIKKSITLLAESTAIESRLMHNNHPGAFVLERIWRIH